MDPPSIDTAGPWRDLQLGDLARAAAGFARLRQSGDRALKELGLAGSLRVAIVQRDLPAAAQLLAAVPAWPSEPRLLVAAALARLRCGTHHAGMPLLERACALADPAAVAAGRQPQVDARNVCSQLELVKRHAQLRRCRAGCDRRHNFPLSFIGTQPVVTVSVNGRPPAQFVVDTGAASSLLTETYAAEIGVSPAPGSEFQIGSPGGMLATHRAAVDLKLEGLELSDVPVVLVALPFDGIAGLISPHDSFGQLVTTLDFRRFSMAVEPGEVASTPADPLARWPLIFSGGNPAVCVTVGARPPRPLTIDTGAYKTVLSLQLDELGKPLVRSDAGMGIVAGAGGKTARSWATTETVPAQAGGLAWKMTRPTVAKRDNSAPSDIESFGLLGMDFLIGRRLVIDGPRRQLLVSRRAVLPPWPVGATARFELIGSYFSGRSTTLTEEVVASDGDQVTLEITIDQRRVGPLLRGAGHLGARFRIAMPDDWATRGSWMITRPAHLLNGDAKQLRARWASLIVGFSTTGGNPKIALSNFTIGDQQMRCTETEIDAVFDKRPARLSVLECPLSPWRMTAMTLREGSDVRWGFRRIR